MSSSISGFPPAAKLCSKCQKAQFRDDVPQLFLHGSRLEFDKEQMPPHEYFGIIPTEFEFVDSFPELSKLVKSAQDGCDLCSFLHEVIVFEASEGQIIGSTSGQGLAIFVTISYLWGPFQEELMTSGKRFYKWPIGLNAMQITLKLGYDNINVESVHTLFCEVQSLRNSDAVSQWLRLGSCAYPSYLDADSICWMNQRLELCEEEHDHDVFDQTYIPERLIDVSSEVPCLVVPEEILRSVRSTKFKYTALSYCWGSGESQAKTTATTLQDRQAGISETEMPPVLQDAIRVTRALGISFLWIDALCILQDDQTDWERQCAEMHNIYGSAHVTLCVANSDSCDEGFLEQTSPCIRLPFQSRQAPEIASSFLVQSNGHLSGDVTNESWQLLSDDRHQSRWSQRGWVFQENVLSARKLIFGRYNLYFVCDYMQQARGKDVHVPPGTDRAHIGKSLLERPKVIYDAWDSNVLFKYRYDASSFSHSTDVLPALSGLARLFGNRLKDVYYAAHWGRDLYRSLSWKGDASWSQPMRPAWLIIPSWSRLAKGYTETYAYSSTFRLDLRSEIRVPKARVVTVGDNPFGALKECRLWIRGYTLDLSRREVQVSAEPPLIPVWGQWHLMVHGRCFGHLVLDLQTGDDPLETCPSTEDINQFKILLLGSFEDYIPIEAPEDEGSEQPNIHNDQNAARKDTRGEECESVDHSEENCEESGSQEQTSKKEASGIGDDGNWHLPIQIPIRRGYGLIISPTGNDGEFRRVGAIFPGHIANPCRPRRDLKALQSLAQTEMVQLV